MKKLIYSFIFLFVLVFVFFGFSLNVNADSTDDVVPAGVYQWDWDVQYTNKFFYNMNFKVYKNADEHVYHNFYYNYSSVDNLTIRQYRYFGYNWWDEEWELGHISTSNGSNVSDATDLRSKNYIRVIPNSTYYCKSPTALAALCFCYDYDKNLITGVNGNNNYIIIQNQTFTTPDNCHYIRFYVSSYITNYTTYNNDICINLSNENINGNYYPYYSTGTSDMYYSFNYRTIQLLDDFVPYDDLDSPYLYDILVENNHIKTVNGWYTFNTSTFPTCTMDYNDATYPGYDSSTYMSIVEWNLEGVLVSPINTGVNNFSTFDNLSFSYNYNTTYVQDILFYDSYIDSDVTVFYYSPPLITDSWTYIQGSKIMLIDQYVPQEYYDFMYSNGTFNYIGDFTDTDYDFVDLVDTIVSVPINYLRNLFNISLLGTTLFSILCAMLTIALVIYVIKKL